MRLTDDRYSRDRLRLDLALRLIQHEARTQTIRRWTGLTDDRIRKLYRSYVSSGAGVRRHRGKSPRQAEFFMRSRPMQRDTSALASILSMFGVLPQAPMADAARILPGVARGELLCDAFETYQRVTPRPQITFEHAVYLATALASGAELQMHRCRHCEGLGVADPIALRTPECLACGRPLRLTAYRAAPAPAVPLPSLRAHPAAAPRVGRTGAAGPKVGADRIPSSLGP